ncbi:MAG: hypothetical protein ACYTG1_04725 [Planctomycetota bacterium]|jgi:Flp pilus assembly protein CpaB
MKSKRIATGVVAAVLAFGIISWFLENVWHYPTANQKNEEPASGEG